jgi:hypothetical protein
MKAKKKDPPKSKRGEKRIQRAVQQRRDKLRAAAPEVYSDLGESYETPEGLPSLEEFAIQRDVNRAYGEAHPMEGATKMVDLGPLMFERWLGRKSSEDGVNYRAPYYRPGDPNAEMANIMQSGRTTARGEDPRGHYDLNAGGVQSTFLETFLDGQEGYFDKGPSNLQDGSSVSRYKPAHKEFQSTKGPVKDILGTVGSLFPPANFLLQGGASLGGRNIPEALVAPVGAALVKKGFSYGDKEVESIAENNANAVKSVLPMAAGLETLRHTLLGAAGDLVVPTSGIGLNPFMREARQIRKETKQDVKKIAEAKSRDMAGKSGRMDAITKRETADVDRLIRLYEKKYGVKVNRKESSPTTYQSFTNGGILKVKKK